MGGYGSGRRSFVGCNKLSDDQRVVRLLRNEYDNDAHWSDEGLNWRDNRRVTWQQLADRQILKISIRQSISSWCHGLRQEAYARCHSARLMDFFEREDIVRGPEKRRYPWGRDFKHGFANTEESGFDKPSAVGLFTTDKTSDGIFDLAGNVAEWLGDDVGDQTDHASWLLGKRFDFNLGKSIGVIVSQVLVWHTWGSDWFVINEMTIYRIPEEHIFPPVSEAEPNGLLGVGSDLAPERLLKAYRSGIFPWYSRNQPDTMVCTRSQICVVSSRINHSTFLEEGCQTESI